MLVSTMVGDSPGMPFVSVAVHRKLVGVLMFLWGGWEGCLQFERLPAPGTSAISALSLLYAVMAQKPGKERCCGWWLSVAFRRHNIDMMRWRIAMSP